MEELLKGLTEKEKDALREAIAVIYFGDSSDYLNGLWGVVSALINEGKPIEGLDIDKLFNLLEPEMAVKEEG